jgi:N-acetylneuraminic acid mutarotase
MRRLGVLLMMSFLTVSTFGSERSFKSDSTDDVITIRWSNRLSLPPSHKYLLHTGLSGAFSGLLRKDLIIAGGTNFPDKYPWEGGSKKWYSDVYQIDISLDGEKNKHHKVSAQLLRHPVAYGISVQLKKSLIWIGGCDSDRCYSDVISAKIKRGTLQISYNEYPPLPVPLANCAGTICDEKIYIAGGQESVKDGKSTSHFFCLDLKNLKKGWQKLPSWPGSSLAFSVCIAQHNRIYLFSGRSFGPDESTVYHTEGYVFNPKMVSWSVLKGEYRVMAGTAFPYGRRKICLVGGVEKILPTLPEHPGFSRKVKVFDTRKNTIKESLVCPYPIPVTTNLVKKGKTFFLTCGEVKPGIRTEKILKGVVE